MDLLPAAHLLARELGVHPSSPDWTTTHAFQRAYNVSRVPAFTGVAPIKVDGIFGPETSHALGATIAFYDGLGQWSEGAQGGGAPSPTTSGAPPRGLSVAAHALKASLGPEGAAAPADLTRAFQLAFNANLVELARHARVVENGVCDLKTQQDAVDVAAHVPEARALLEALAAVQSTDDPTWWTHFASQTRAFQRAWNHGIDEEVRSVSLNTQGVFDLKTANALADFLAVEALPASSSTTTVSGAGAVPGVRLRGRLAVLELEGEYVPRMSRTSTSGIHIHVDLKGVGKFAEHVLSAVQGVASVIPGIGTGISTAIGAAEGLLDGGGLLDVALRAAYGAIPIPDGMRQVTDPILDAVIGLIKSHGNITETALIVIRDRVPSGLPRDVFDTLVRIVEKKRHIDKTPADTHAHMVASYTQGKDAAIEQGLQRHVPPEVREHLRRLPPRTAVFPPAERPRPPAPPPPLRPGETPPVRLRPAPPPPPSPETVAERRSAPASPPLAVAAAAPAPLPPAAPAPTAS
jgi:peptidoglycan hydrolase-like protein with peptidoglycan-binding domain